MVRCQKQEILLNLGYGFKEDNMPIAQVNAQGITNYTVTENQMDVALRMRELFGQDISLSVQTPQGQIVGLVALLMAEINDVIVSTGNSMSVEHAAGVQLDRLGMLLDVRRDQATSTILEAVCTGVPGTVIPEGSIVGAASGNFRTLSEVTLSTGAVSVNVESVVTGAVEVPAGTLNKIVTLIAGWETVNNLTDASIIGTDRQPDASYRAAIIQKSGQKNYGGPNNSIGASLIASGVNEVRLVENNTGAAVTTQEWPVPAHSVLIVTEGGSASDTTRAVEHSRGLGVGVVTSYRSSAPAEDSVLNAITNGSITWDGTAYPGLDLSSAADGPARAAALSTLLPIDVVWIDGRFEAIFGWQPEGAVPAFGTGSVETALGFAAPSVTPPGPYVNARNRDLTIFFTVRRDENFPADGLNQIRQTVTDRVNRYGIGEQFWSNDIISDVERIPGTRVTTAVTATYNNVAVSGVDVPVNIKWSIPSDNLTVTLTT